MSTKTFSIAFIALIFCLLATFTLAKPDLDKYRHKVLRATNFDKDDDSQGYMVFSESRVTMELFLGEKMRKQAPNVPRVLSFSGDLDTSLEDRGFLLVTPSIMYNATGDDKISVKFLPSDPLSVGIYNSEDIFNTIVSIRNPEELELFKIYIEWEIAPDTKGAVSLEKNTDNANEVFGYWESHKARYLKPTPFSPDVYYDTIVVNPAGYFITDAGVRRNSSWTKAPNFDALLSVTGSLEVTYHDELEAYQLHVTPFVELSGSTYSYSDKTTVMDRYAHVTGDTMLVFVLDDSGERVAEAEFHRQK